MTYFLPGSESVLFGTDQVARSNATLALSLFHTAFNVINVLLLAGFVPFFVRFIEKHQKEKTNTQYRLQYISSGMMSSPELSMSQAHKEIELFGKLIEKMHFNVKGLLFNKQKKRKSDF
jgi:phosphate:Na+ symporter